MAKSIGIDLGTTNSVAGIKKVDTEILKNSENEFITPSCVSCKKGAEGDEMVVGRNALEWRKQDPANTITAVKRLMGRSFDDEYVQSILKEHKLPYTIRRHSAGTEDSIGVILNGREYSPEQISAEILKKIKNDAEKELGDEVDAAVITAPAYFNDKQKHATRIAAHIAGLKVKRLLPEPTAAAISFGIDNVSGEEAKNVLVFDFGGGTLDLSLLTISGGVFLEQGKGGDMWLGGEDIDYQLSKYVLEQFAKENDISDIDKFIDSQEEDIRNHFLGELKARVEKAKIELSDTEISYVEIAGLLKNEDGDIIDLDVEISRDILEEILKPLNERIIRLVKQLITETDYDISLIDKILMVGGSSKIPCVVDALKEEFGEDKVMVHERPMLAIAEGAAILSHKLADVWECPNCGNNLKQEETFCKTCNSDLTGHIVDSHVVDIVHTSSHDYYIHLENGEKVCMLPKNTPLPATADETFTLESKDQYLLHIKFSNPVNDKEETIGNLWIGLNDLTSKSADKLPQVKVILNVDENNLAEVTVEVIGATSVKTTKQFSRGSADEQILEKIENIIHRINNEKKYTVILCSEVEEWINIVLARISGLIDKNTEKVNIKLMEQLNNSLDMLTEFLENENLGLGRKNYVEFMFRFFAPLVPDDKKGEVLEGIRKLKEAIETGDKEKFERNLRRIEDFLASDDLVLARRLTSFANAAEIAYEKGDIKRAKTIDNRIAQIINNIINQNADKVSQLIEKTYDIAIPFLEDYERTDIIHKGLKRF